MSNPSAPPRRRRSSEGRFWAIGLVATLVLASAPPASATVVIDQEPDVDESLPGGVPGYPSGLRVEFAAPVGQSFIPTISRHVGVELVLSRICSQLSDLPAIFTVDLRARFRGPALATGISPAFECPELDGTGEWVEILFDEPVSIEPGNSYFLTVRTANQAGFWRRAGQNPYPFGHSIVSGSPDTHFDWGFRTLVELPEQVDIDIKPGNLTNPINPTSHGVIRLAVLGSESFGATEIDRTTLTFGPEHAAPAHRRGGRLVDVNDDGFADLVSHYPIQQTGIAFGDTEACVMGALLDGTEFEGCDSLVTRENRNPRRPRERATTRRGGR